MLIKTEQAMLQFGRKFGQNILLQKHFPVVIELLGDLGVGKTTFTRGLAEGLGVKETISSPSFTISRSYAGKNCTLAHYDFYRLDEPGLMSEDLAESINGENSVTVVEWGQSIANTLPANRQKIHIAYVDENAREVKVS